MFRYRDFNRYLRGQFGCRVQKITLDAGFTCPNRDGRLGRDGCIFCNAKGSGTGAYARGQSLEAQLTTAKTALAKRYKAKKFIAYFQAHSNTYAPVARLRACYQAALAVDDIVGLAIGTRPDCVSNEILDLLEDYARQHMIWLEYGIQSASDQTLSLLRRGHDFACVREAVARTRHRGIKICGHVIVGLPGERPADVRRTAREVAALGLDGIKIHLLYVVKGTPLAQMYQQGRYECLSRFDYVSQVVDFLERLPANVVVQRLTGDPHPKELVAPSWALEKRQTLAAIQTELAARDTWQGKQLGVERAALDQEDFF